MKEDTLSKKQHYTNSIKRYIIPTLSLFLVMVIKLASIGILKDIFLWLTDVPIYKENGTLGVIQIFTLVMLDMAIGLIYVWVKILGQDEIEGSDAKVSVWQSLKQTIDGDGLKRGFNYLWMSAVSSIVVTILWSIITMLVITVMQGLIVSNPEFFLSTYVLLGIVRSVVSYLIKTGILSYTVYATMSEGNILKAWMYTARNIIRLTVAEINYIAVTAIGLLGLLVGAFATHSLALERKTEKWDKMIRNYERRVLYGKVKE